MGDLRARPLPRYRRDLPFSWVVGDFCVHELLRHAPQDATEVRYHSSIDPTRAARLERLCNDLSVPWRRDDAAVREKRSKGSADVMALFRKPSPQRDGGFSRRLCLVSPREHGNLGTILRTAAAFDVRDVVVAGGIDPWSPHVVRASLGAVFYLRLTVVDGLDVLRPGLDEATTWFLDGRGGSTIDDASPLSEPWTLMVGPEWPGLSADAVAPHRSIRIAHGGHVESLNVAVAVGIALHALTTVRTS